MCSGRAVVGPSQTEPSAPANKFHGVIRSHLLGRSGSILPEEPTRVVYDEDANGANHGQSLKHPEQPLGAESIAIHALGKLTHAVDASNLVLVSKTPRGSSPPGGVSLP